MTEKSEMEQQIQLMLEKLLPAVDFSSSADFIEDELLDSLAIWTLIAGLETEFGIKIDAMEITPENFQNRAAIAELVAGNIRTQEGEL